VSKKILITVMTLALVAALGVGGALAVFTDTETSEGNTFTAGTLQLDVEKDGVEVKSHTFENIKPGDSAGWHGVTSPWQDGLSWDVKNIGSLPGTLTVSVDSIMDYYWDQNTVALDANGVPESLELAGTGDPRLSTQLRPQVRVNGVWKTESSGLHNLNSFTVDLVAGQTVNIAIAWSFYPAAGNEYQGTKSEVDFKFYLEQQ